MKNLIGSIDLREGATIYLDKPLGWSSFGLVNKFRYEACRHLGIKKLKVGHAGTLDPLATGVMILCTGKHTKQIERLQQGDKEYIADIRLGQTTPTLDLESDPDEFFPTEHITRQRVEAILPKFLGFIEQTPPIFSAIKIDGKRAYKLARKGREDIEMPTKTIYIGEIELLDCSLPDLRLRVVCGKGTYIRSLARDIGQALDSGAHLTALRRTRVGEALIDNCLSIEQIPDFLAEHVITSPLLDSNE